jgi:elongation factor Ts
MDISITSIKQLREKTGAGMSDCKKALEDSNGDLEKAIEYLRKKGAATVAKRSDKVVKEGAVKCKVSEDGKKAAIIELNCETDFVSKGQEFQKFSQNLADVALKLMTEDKETILNEKVDGKNSIMDNLNSLVASVGERVEFKRASIKQISDGFIASYIHFGSKLGSMVVIKGNRTDSSLDLGNKIAMQIVAMNPIALNRSAVKPELIEKEKEIYLSQARNEKKPENIIERIVQNKIEKFYQENCLLEQEFIQESNLSVKDLVERFNKSNSENLEIVDYIRYQLGQ